MRQLIGYFLLYLLCMHSSTAAERIIMDETAVIGNQELPKVLYIVPWKKSELPDLNQPPLNSLIDDALQPVDPYVFKRQIEYYEALSSSGNKNLRTSQ